MMPAQLAVLADHLRSILSEQDAADVARWAQHPEAVRELLLHDPLMFEHDAAGVCPRCDAPMGEVHNLTSRIESIGLRFSCPVTAAWRALGDPRGAADIERAWEEALRQNVRLFPQWARTAQMRPLSPEALVALGPSSIGIAAEDLPEGATVEFTLGGPPTQPVRLSPFHEVGGQLIHRSILVPMGSDRTHWPDGSPRATPCNRKACERREQESEYYVGQATYSAQRSESDARGMEAVEDEARDIHARAPYVHGGFEWASQRA